MKPILLTIMLLAGHCASLLAQGDLDPAGPPATGMKRLDQVHPGTPVSGSGGTLSAPGHYYFTGNLSGRFFITSSNVTLDLNGFTLTASVAAAGIQVESEPSGTPLHNVTIRNGIISGGNAAVRFIDVCNGTLSDLSVKSVGGFAFNLSGASRCDGNRIERCASIDCRGGVLISADTGATCNGNTIRSCVFDNSSNHGFSFSGAGTCSGNLVQDCLVGSSALSGINMQVAGGRVDGNRVERSTFADHATGGIRLLGTNGVLDGNEIVGCTIYGATNSAGIDIRSTGALLRGNRIEGCAMSRNGQSAVDITGAGCDGNLVKGCLIHNTVSTGNANSININAGNGNRVIDNHVVGGNRGIVLQVSDDNIVTGNSFFENTQAPWLNSAGVTYVRGPIVGTVGQLATSGADAHPWANFTR